MRGTKEETSSKSRRSKSCRGSGSGSSASGKTVAAVGVREEVVATSAKGEESAEGTRRIDGKRQDQTPSEPASAGHAALTREEIRPVVRLASTRTVVGVKDESVQPEDENAVGIIDGGDGPADVESGHGGEASSSAHAFAGCFGIRSALRFILLIVFIWPARMLTSRGSEVVGYRDAEKAHQSRTNSFPHSSSPEPLMYYAAYLPVVGDGAAMAALRRGLLALQKSAKEPDMKFF